MCNNITIHRLPNTNFLSITLSDIIDLCTFQMTTDVCSSDNVGGHGSEQDCSAMRQIQTANPSLIIKNDSEICDEDGNKKNLQNAKIGRIDLLSNNTDVLNNSIFVIMTIVSLSILLKEGSICISK